MSRILILGQRCQFNDKMLIRGVFTNKKNLWDCLEKEVEPGKLEDFTVRDDVGGKVLPASYGAMCNKLRKVGRVCLFKEDVREFLIVDSLTNELRGWDIDEEGNPICNPVPE